MDEMREVPQYRSDPRLRIALTAACVAIMALVVAIFVVWEVLIGEVKVNRAKIRGLQDSVNTLCVGRPLDGPCAIKLPTPVVTTTTTVKSFTPTSTTRRTSTPTTPPQTTSHPATTAMTVAPSSPTTVTTIRPTTTTTTTASCLRGILGLPCPVK